MMELWWGKFSFDGMPAFRDSEDGLIWVWDPESKTYTKKQKADQPDRGHQTGGDNNLFDPFVHTEWPGVPELEGHMAASRLAQKFAPEGQVKCPNCQEVTDKGVCPTCGKELSPEWNKENQKIDFLSQPGNPTSEFTSLPDREPKRNRMKTDDSYPSMLSSVDPMDQPGDLTFPSSWDEGQRAVRDYNLEDLESEGLSQEELAAINRLVTEIHQGLVHPATSQWDITPRELAKEYGYLPQDREASIKWPDCPACGQNAGFKTYGFARDHLECNNCGHLATARKLAELYHAMKPTDDDPWDKQQPGQLGLDAEVPKYGAWDEDPEPPQDDTLPITWSPPAPGKSFEEMEEMLERYGWSKEPCMWCGGSGEDPKYQNSQLKMKCPKCEGKGTPPGRRPGQNRRKVNNNTYLERRDDGSIALRLHNTDVVRWHPDRVVMDTGGWHSRTTRDRMNEFIPGNVYTQRRQQFYVPPNQDPYGQGNWDPEHIKNNKTDWYDQMALDYEGNVIPHEGPKNVNPRYISNFTLAQKIASEKLSQEEWEQWFGDDGPARTEVGKWLQDTKGQLFYDQGLKILHEDIARKNGVPWRSGVGALGSIYNDGSADVQVIFPGAAVDQQAIQAQLQQVFGPVNLAGPISGERSEQKGTVFQPVVIKSGQFVLHDASTPITGQAWVKERSNGVPYSPEMILVAEHLLTDDYEIYAQGTKAIITATGGLTSHAAQLAASEGHPVVVGIGPDYNKIETGNYLKIDPVREDITVLPYLNATKSPDEARQFQDSLKQYDRQRNPQFYEDTLPTFSHYDEELAWRQANDAKLEDCPECDAPMAERDGTKFCPDCGHKQPIITVQAQASQKVAVAFLPALAAPAAALLGRLGLSGGAKALAGGNAAASVPGVGTLMRGAMSPKNLLMAQGVKSMLPGGQQSGGTVINQYGVPPATTEPSSAFQQGTFSNIKTAIELGDPEEEPIYVPEPKPLTLPEVDPAEEERKRREREREREKEKPQKVPASVKRADTFGEEESGWATKNRGEDSDPEHDGSGANFEEKGDSPELLKDVDGEGNAKGDPDQATPKAEQGGGDPQKALELFDSNLPLIIEYATSEEDGSTHPILMALDEILEAAFPGYKDAVDEAVEAIEEATGEDIDQDNEEGEPEEHVEAVEEAADEDVDEKTASVWHYGWETSPTATPAPTMPVPGQSGTCQLCGQSHMPGTPCPTMNGAPVMQQPGATGQGMMMPPQPGTQPKVVTHTVEADASHLQHQHEDEGGDFQPLDEDDDNFETEVDSVWADEDGDPLVEGADYELLSSEYAIPDKVTIDAISGDSIVFTIHSGDVDYRDELTKDDMGTFGYTFVPASSDGIDSVSDFALEDEDPIRPGHDPLPQEDDLTEPATVVSSLDNYTGSFRGDNPDSRDWLMGGGGGVAVDPELMAKFAGKDYTPREQRDFIDEQGTARNLDKLDLEGTHYVLDDDLGTGNSLW